MGWEIYPEGLYEVLMWLKERTGGIPLYITENGAAFPDEPDENGYVRDLDRIDYFQQHLEQAARAISDGVDLQGYFAYTFLDSFECECGYSKKFGLVRVDRRSLARVIKASGWWYSDFIRQQQQ